MEEMDLQNEHLEIEKKSNGSQIFNEPYSAENVERIKEMIHNFYNTGIKKYYSIHVDGETVVSRNCDARKFNKYLPFLNKHTKKVEVKLYSGYSPKCNTYIFYLHRGLSGAPSKDKVDVKEEINKALAEQRLEFELDQLKTELEKKEKKIKKLKSEIEGHSNWTPDNVNKTLMNGLKAIGSINAIRKGGLQGVPNQEVQPESEVHVEMDGEGSTSKSEVLFEEMLQQFGDETMFNALGWTGVLAAHPEIRELVKKEVKRIKKEKEKEDGEA